MPRKTTVLFIWDVNKHLKNYLTDQLRKLTDFELIFPSTPSSERYLELAPDANIIVGWRPTKELLQAAENLQLFVNPGAGVQHLIDLFKDLNRSRNVVLTNCHGNSSFVAQHAVALLLALSNKIIIHHNWMVEGKWRRGDKDGKSTPLRNQVIGLLGYGAVNQKVHRLLSSFDLKFSILRRDWTKQQSPPPTRVRKYSFNDLHQFLDEVNILVIAAPLTSLTRQIIKNRELELLGSNGFLINIARGELVEESSLFRALKDNVIAGAAIDVWYNYKPEPDKLGHKYPFSYPFHKLQNVILSPHRGASPLDDLQRWDEIIENIKRYAKGNEDFLNVVDLEREY